MFYLFVGPKCKPYFIPEVFAKLQQGDIHGRISIMSLFNYIMKKVWLHQTRIGISVLFVSFSLFKVYISNTILVLYF